MAKTKQKTIDDENLLLKNEIKTLKLSLKRNETHITKLNDKISELLGEIREVNKTHIKKPVGSPNEKRKNETREMIEKMFNDGVSYRAIATALNANNIPTISGRGQWYAQKIHLEVKLLKEEKR